MVCRFQEKRAMRFHQGLRSNIGALASAASRLSAAQRNTIWALSGGCLLPVSHFLDGECLGVTDGNGPTGLQDACPERKIVALRRGYEVGLKFNSQNCRVVRHQREGGISAGCIECGGDNAGVNKTMLLRIGGRMASLARPHRH
jgi:hypothetical protein